MGSTAVAFLDNIVSAGGVALNIVAFGLVMVAAGSPFLALRQGRTLFQTLGVTNNWVLNYVFVVLLAAIGELVLLLGILVAGDQLFSTPQPMPGIEDTPTEDRFLLFALPIGVGLYLLFLWLYPMVISPRLKNTTTPKTFSWTTKISFAGAILWFQAAGFWALSQGYTPPF
ncbi:hypothetical protein [Haladaptatus sp. DYF46]|uniref:hypothetical protein n=1 Tax=Haladaptatus sp. DYF46 TaxID=2886041 RepID=UPI001E61D16E|nr:hypothetical protein [Haladaptatus sp. DYF46]